MRAREAGRPTISSSSAARRCAAALATFPCTRIGSAICGPIRCTALSECIAPWNTIEAPTHLTARSRPHPIVSTSSPPSRISPVTDAFAGSSRSTAIANVDFPQPDSPAMPSVPPASSVKSTPRTAGTAPREPR